MTFFSLQWFWCFTVNVYAQPVSVLATKAAVWQREKFEFFSFFFFVCADFYSWNGIPALFESEKSKKKRVLILSFFFQKKFKTCFCWFFHGKHFLHCITTSKNVSTQFFLRFDFFRKKVVVQIFSLFSIQSAFFYKNNGRKHEKYRKNEQQNIFHPIPMLNKPLLVRGRTSNALLNITRDWNLTARGEFERADNELLTPVNGSFTIAKINGLLAIGSLSPNSSLTNKRWWIPTYISLGKRYNIQMHNVCRP